MIYYNIIIEIKRKQKLNKLFKERSAKLVKNASLYACLPITCAGTAPRSCDHLLAKPSIFSTIQLALPHHSLLKPKYTVELVNLNVECVAACVTATVLIKQEKQ